jgi:hypothetical protein
MKKVIIKNKAGMISWGAEMQDPTEWIAQCVAANAWGLPERWVIASECSEDDIKEALDVKEEESLEGPVTSYKLPAEYSIEIIDITAEHALAQCLSKRRAEYPTAEQFLNAFFDGGEEALEELKALRLAIKAKYPKP